MLEAKIENKNPVIQGITSNTSAPKEPEIQVNESSIERIIIFYTDRSFKEYFPEK